MLSFQVLLAVVGLFLGISSLYIVRSYWHLRSVPGPPWARVTNLPRLSWVLSRRAQEIHLDLHTRYGDFVRFGPNMVSISDPALIPTVYPMRRGFPKGDFYKALMPYTRSGSLPVVFNSRDEDLHKQLKTPIASLFSVSNISAYEPLVDTVLDVACKSLDERFAKTGKVFDLTDWLQYFAFDVMGSMTFSKRYGFLEEGRDVDGILQTIWTFMQTIAPVTQVTWFDGWWNKNPFVARFRTPFGSGILGIVTKFISERQEEIERAKLDVEKRTSVPDGDFLAHFIEIQKKNESIPPWAVTAWTFSNVIAGSDSTGVIMRQAFYGLLSNPSTLTRLREELTSANLSKPYPRQHEVRDLPYLDACINEALRLHPPFSLPFERVVPKEGIQIGDRFFEGGTIVGMNPYVVGRHRPTFGDDVEAFRPERWLGISEEQHRKMAASILTFGAGRRVCQGKHVALLEMKKLIPTLVLRYDFNIINTRDYWVENCWFFRQKGLNVTITKRN